MKRETKAEAAPAQVGRKLENTPAYKQAYQQAQAGGMNETESHEFALDIASRYSSEPAPAQSGQPVLGDWNVTKHPSESYVSQARFTVWTPEGRDYAHTFTEADANEIVKLQADKAEEVDSTHTFDCICGACQRDRIANPLTAREKKLILRNGLLRQENAELIEALRELLTSEESPHSETVRFLAREQARTILAKIGGQQ